MPFHSLRHTSRILILNDICASIKEVQQRVGHANPSTTINIYGGQATSKLDEVVAQRLDEIAAQALDDLITPIPVPLHPVAPKKESLPVQ